MTILDFRKNFTEAIDDLRVLRQQVTITKNGRPIALVTPIITKGNGVEVLEKAESGD